MYFCFTFCHKRHLKCTSDNISNDNENPLTCCLYTLILRIWDRPDFGCEGKHPVVLVM